MLANALAGVALIALAANTILSAGLISERIAVRRAAQTYLNREYQRATQALISEIEPFARGGSFPDPLPSFTFPPACVDERTPCGFTGSAQVSAQVADSGSSPAPCESAEACANNEQTNLYVAERRVVAKISVTVQAGDGSVLATREDDVTLRAFNAPPYVAIAGARDRASDAILINALPGEDAGRPPATANPCAAASPGTSDDTVARVAYENAQTGACSDASAWRSSAYSIRGAFNLTR